MQAKNLSPQETSAQHQAETPILSASRKRDALSGWRSSMEAWWKALLAIFPLFIVTRIVFVLLTYFGVILFSVPKYSLKALSLHMLVYSWDRWDAVHFTNIATSGYRTLVDAAFFPLYPLLEHGLSISLHHNPFITGMLISNLALFGTLLVLYRLVEIEFDRETASKTVLYLSIFPTALFFFTAYNESLFMLFMLLCFYALRRGCWWVAGLFGALATLTRSAGLLLAVPFLYEYVRQVLPQAQQAWRERHMGKLLKLLAGLPAILLIPLALGIYAYYLKQRFNDPLAFSHAQSLWRAGFSAPWSGPLWSLSYLSNHPLFTFFDAHNTIDLTAMLFALVLIVLCFVGPERFRADQWSMPLYCLLALLLPLIFPGHPFDPLASMQRFVLELFAAFIVLARYGRRPWLNQTYMILGLPLLAFFTLQFLLGYWTI
jgi:Gpi18-like mannosyltransferase